MTPKTNNLGFSLMELVVVIALGTMILLTISSVYQISQQAYRNTEDKAELSQNARVIIDRISRELRQNEDIVTTLPLDNSNPANLAHEIMFQDGHDLSAVRYIRYYLNNHAINRQLVIYYFKDDENYYVRSNTTDENGNHPIEHIVEDKVIGEYVDDVEFWGNKLININLYLSKNKESQIIYTAIYGRNS